MFIGLSIKSNLVVFLLSRLVYQFQVENQWNLFADKITIGNRS